MNNAKFTMIDVAFTCNECGMQVEPLGYTARDHCPSCLCSLHVDNNPGDRACNCHGILRPVAFDTKKGEQLVYVCDSCGEIKRNKVATDDNRDYIFEIMTKAVDPNHVSQRIKSAKKNGRDSHSSSDSYREKESYRGRDQGRGRRRC